MKSSTFLLILLAFFILSFFAFLILSSCLGGNIRGGGRFRNPFLNGNRNAGEEDYDYDYERMLRDEEEVQDEFERDDGRMEEGIELR